MSTNDASQGVSSCYVFKSRLQEYAQKVGLPTPVYETIKEGPSHEPIFRSTVIVNDVRYDSLPGFFNRKAAEQSAAEVALVQLAQSGDMKDSISQPVHETGLCKNLLQEYAQKMNYAMPSYECHKNEAPGREHMFSCSIEIGGIKYIGASARTKKEAEIKTARTALLAIQSSAPEAYNELTANSEYTVLPFKKKPTNSGATVQEAAVALKPKKGRFKKKSRKKKRPVVRTNEVDNNTSNVLKPCSDRQTGCENNQSYSICVQETDSGIPSIEMETGSQNGSCFNGNKENILVSSNCGDYNDENLTSLTADENSRRSSIPGHSFLHFEGQDASITEVSGSAGGQ